MCTGGQHVNIADVSVVLVSGPLKGLKQRVESPRPKVQLLLLVSGTIVQQQNVEFHSFPYKL